MAEIHQVEIPKYEAIIREIEERTEDTYRHKAPRSLALEYDGSFLIMHIKSIKNHLLTKIL